MARFHYVTQIEIAAGAVRLLPRECAIAGIRKPLVVTDAGVRTAGVLHLSLAALGDLPPDDDVIDHALVDPGHATGPRLASRDGDRRMLQESL